MATGKSNPRGEQTSPGKVWLCLHFPLLPVEVFTRHQPDAPVVITENHRVAFLNDGAAATGIQPGSSMNTAYTLSEQIICFERDEHKEIDTLSRLAQWAYQFSPAVAVKPPHSLLLDIGGCLKLFHGLDNLRELIRTGLDRLGFSVVCGINATPLSALCLAEAGIEATGLPGDVQQSLADLPVHYLRVDPKARASLHQMGISRCRQLFELPPDGLNRRFGVFFTDYLARLTGQSPDPQKFISDRPVFRSDVTFLSDVTSLEPLVFPMKRLLGELHDFLTARQLLVNQFSFRLSHRSHEPRSFTVFLASPDNDAQMFLMLAQLQLDRINDMPEVDCLSLAARHFVGCEEGSGSADLFQGALFHGKRRENGRPGSRADEARAVRLINMMTARLGPQACFGVSLANDHRPEQAWKPVALSQKNYWHDSTPGENARPLYLLPVPKPLSVQAGMPCLSGRLELLQGPERIDFGWWDNLDGRDRSIARDYFIARHSSGSLYWVYRHLADQSWFLHGIFS